MFTWSSGRGRRESPRSSGRCCRRKRWFSHLRTKDGAEVDFIIDRGGTLTPIEVKWTENPTVQDARHLLAFLAEHPKQAKHGYIVCRCSRPAQLHDQIIALPWFCL